MAPDIIPKVKEEVERLLRARFIRPTRYVEWLYNIVPVMKKNGKIRVCIDFRKIHSCCLPLTVHLLSEWLVTRPVELDL